MYPVLVKPHQVKLQPGAATVYILRDNLRGQTQVNKTGAAILALCDGRRNSAEIVSELTSRYGENEAKVATFVADFLDKSFRFGTIIWKSEPHPVDVHVTGCYDYWTPDAVVIELTHNCPLSCRHCFLDAGTGPSLNSDILMRLCEELVALQVDKVQLTGGEPFLHPDMEGATSYLAQHGREITIATSGSVLSDTAKRVLRMLERSRDVVQVSVDGMESTHNAMRRAGNSYSAAMRFIAEAVDCGAEVHVATCVTEDSFGEIESLSAHLKKLGVRRHRIGVVSERGRAAENGLTVSVELQEEAARLRESLRRKLATESFTITDLEADIPSAYRAKYCGAGCKVLKIAPDATVHPCAMTSWPIGSLREDSLAGILTKGSCAFAQVMSPSTELCGACAYAARCKGCMAEGLLYSLRVPKCAWFANSGIQQVLTQFPLPS